MAKQRFKVGQVVFDRDMCEYVTIARSKSRLVSATHGDEFFVFNPRCGEKYWTPVRPLTKKEAGR